MAKFILTKYTVDACWYGRRPTGTQPDATEFSGIVRRYFAWINGLPSIEDTLVQGVDVYVREVASDRGNVYLFTLWLTTSRDGSSCALKLTSRPGAQSKVEQRRYSQGFTPGCPMYLYVDTSSMVVYTIKPEKSVIGGKSFFERAIRNFMLFHPPCEQLLLRNEAGVAVAGNDAVQSVRQPIFRLKQSVNQTEADSIIGLAPEIRKIVHTIPVTDETKSVLTPFVGNVWQLFGLSIGESIESNIHELRYEVNVDLSTEDLREMLEHQNHSTFSDRLGFKVSASEGGRILWADRVVDQTTCELNVSPRNGVFTASRLMNSVKQYLQSQGGVS